MVLLVAAVIFGGTLVVEKVGAAVVVDVLDEVAITLAEVVDLGLCNFLLHNTFCV